MSETVTMVVNGAAVTCPKRPTLLQTLQEGRVSVDTACGGAGSCHLCRVTVVAGVHQLPAASPKEIRALGNVRISIGTRLACQIPPHPDLVLTIAPPRRSPRKP